ncbi:MAG: hypothetical protein ACI4GB_07215 [Acutalibacteraceae bacterium]
MNYEIRENTQFNSKEIYFTGKPSQEVRDALKALKFRWHSVKKCWYGFADERTLINAILDTNTEEQDEPATVTTDGYLGGGAVYGIRCINQHSDRLRTFEIDRLFSARKAIFSDTCCPIILDWI